MPFGSVRLAWSIFVVLLNVTSPTAAHRCLSIAVTVGKFSTCKAKFGVIFNGLIEIGYAHPTKLRPTIPWFGDTLWAAAVTPRPTMVPATKGGKPRMAVSLCFESVYP